MTITCAEGVLRVLQGGHVVASTGSRRKIEQLLLLLLLVMLLLVVLGRKQDLLLDEVESAKLKVRIHNVYNQRVGRGGGQASPGSQGMTTGGGGGVLDTPRSSTRTEITAILAIAAPDTSGRRR